MQHHTDSQRRSTQSGPSELYRLIASNNYQWDVILQRCTTHPHEVGSSVNLRNDKGYTALHTVTAYNHATHGDVLVPVIRALLSAEMKLIMHVHIPWVL